MAGLLQSYIGGRWTNSDDGGKPLHSAITGDEVARISRSGVDIPILLDHGRNIGGPALQKLTFHERASQLKQLGKVSDGRQGRVLRTVDRDGRYHP